MRNCLAGICCFVSVCAASSELMVLSVMPVELWQSQNSAYLPVAMVQQILNHYPSPYTIESVSLNRAFAELQSRSGACVMGVRKTTERQQNFLFSQPYVIAPEIRLVVKADSDSDWAARLKVMQDQDGLVSLQRVLDARTPPVLVTEDGRSYGAAIDPILSKHRRNSPIYVKTAKVSNFGDTLPMLNKGFVDMALEYPVAITDLEFPMLASFRLKEADPFALAYFACNRDAVTAELLQQLDSAILQFRNQPEFKQMLLAIYPPAERAKIWQAWLRLSGS
ncbi:MAG: transporter substrate-binding domain-containing protein [Rheinheimera sp.]|nr:transporter substrate-binding domain-containing protein [Rheinheimera sp.]